MLIFLPAIDRFHFERDTAPDLRWVLVVLAALSTGIMIFMAIVAWKLFHG